MFAIETALVAKSIKEGATVEMFAKEHSISIEQAKAIYNFVKSDAPRMSMIYLRG